MPRVLKRLAVFLLLPCLVADPCLAITFQSPSPFSRLLPSQINQRIFQDQALEPVTLWMHRALERVRTAPRVRVMASAIAVGAAIGAAIAYPHVDPAIFWRTAVWAAT